MRGSSTFSVTPARHDQRAGKDANALLPSPADRFKKLIRAIGFPIGEKQFCIRCESMHHLSAQDAVLAILGFQIVIAPTRMNDDLAGQNGTQMSAVAAKPRIEYRNLHAATAITRGMPAIDPKQRQVM
jgi:hypothetical protein